MARLGVAPGTALGAEAIAARVSVEAERDRALTHGAPVGGLPGFARALAATLAELRRAGVGAGALARLQSGVASRDLAPVFCDPCS
jgi:hypothetical protein